jgi:hypothetical protein
LAAGCELSGCWAVGCLATAGHTQTLEVTPAATAAAPAAAAAATAALPNC